MHNRITSEIFQVGGSNLTSPYDAAIYLIRIGTHAALVDAGCGSGLTNLMKNIKSCGVLPEQIEYLLITHCHIDHTGGASALKEQLPCIAVAHEKDAVFLEKGDNITTAAGWYGLKIKAFTIENKLTHARETILLGGREILAIHVPGHSPGSVVYMLESENRKVLFAQDVHGPLHPILKSNQNDYIESLKKMRDLEAEVLCEGHFGIYEGIDDVRRFIESYMPTGADEQTY